MVFRKYDHEITQLNDRKLESSICSKCGRYALSVDYLLDEDQLGIYIFDFLDLKLYEYGRFEKDTFVNAPYTYWHDNCVVVMGSTSPTKITQFLVVVDHETRIGTLVHTRIHAVTRPLIKNIRLRRSSSFASEISAWGKRYSFLVGCEPDSTIFLVPRCPLDQNTKIKYIDCTRFPEQLLERQDPEVMQPWTAHLSWNEPVILNDRLLSYHSFADSWARQVRTKTNVFIESSLAKICRDIENKVPETEWMNREFQAGRLHELTKNDCFVSGRFKHFVVEHESYTIHMNYDSTDVFGWFVYNALDDVVEKIRQPLRIFDHISRHSSGVLLKWSYDEENNLTVEKLSEQRRKMWSLKNICKQKLILRKDMLEKLRPLKDIVFSI